MVELNFPLVLITKNGLLKYARFKDDIIKTNSYLLKKGIFENLIIIDSNSNMYRVLNAQKVKSFGLFWGLSPFLYQNIIVDLIMSSEFENLNLVDFKKFFLKAYKKDARLIGGLLCNEDLKFISEANSVKEILEYFTDSFFNEYPV
jgi:hypothetical protein